MQLYEKPALREITGPSLRPGGLALTRKGLGFCGFGPGDKVLDIGCGPGESLGLLRDLHIKALGLDKSPALLQEAAKRGQAIMGDAMRLPVAGAGLDGAICECVLSLLPDKAAALGEIKRALRPGGRLLLSDLYLRQAAEPGPAGGSCIAGAETLERLHALLKEVGFSILHESDESRALKELAVNMIFKYGSPAAFFEHWGLEPCAAGQAKNLGYTLIVAEKHR